MRNGARWRLASLIFGLTFVLGACARGLHSSDTPSAEEAEINTLPVNYKPDILGAMHAYLNDPTGIRDAGISEPALKTVGNAKRYVVCVRFNAKKRGNDYAGVKEIAAVFMVGRFDRFETSRDPSREHEPSHDPFHDASRDAPPCAGAIYAPFPELQKLAR